MYRTIQLIAAALILSSAPSAICAAQFDILGTGDPYGGKSVFLSDDGQVALVSTGGYRDTFLWTMSDGTRTTHSLSISDRKILTRKSSSDGRVTNDGRHLGPDWYHSMTSRRTDDGQTIDLGDLPGGDVASRSWAVSADGSTIVGSSIGQSGWFEPFRWTADDGMIPLGKLPGIDRLRGEAWDVSADGNVIVGEISQLRAGRQAFRWTPSSGTQGLGDLPGGSVFSTALGVSADGNTIVGSGTISGGPYSQRAFIWNAENGMQDLDALLRTKYRADLQGVTLNTATAVSANGRVIVGTGTKAFGTNIDTVAWRLVIPEPSTMLLTIMAATTLFGLRFRNRIA
jgi:uncharacterized membrane protein